MKERNFKRKCSIILAMILALGTTSLAACGGVGGGRDSIVTDGKTVNVKVFKRGYGADWVYELKKNFEKAYADEGYKLNILTPSPDIQGDVVYTEMAMGVENSGIDLYITQGSADMMGERGTYGVLAEDIRETVFNQKAIGYDGVEEDLTVGEKLNGDLEKWLCDSTGVMYGFAWAGSVDGLVVNTRKLAKYGLALPVTTNQFFDCVDKIYTGYNGIENSEKSGTYPITTSASGNYVNDGFAAWQRQYDMEEYEKFWSMQETVDGQKVDMTQNGYEVFKSDAIQSGLEKVYRYLDIYTSNYGSTTQSLDQAQASIMKDKNGAVFMLNGDWFLNEVKLNYSNALNDITFIKTPINSDLGIRLFGENSSYGLTAVKADELLAKISVLSDENKEIAEIVQIVYEDMGITVSEEDALEVAEARNSFICVGLDHKAFITKNSPTKDVAELVLRMMASDDFAATFSKYANVNSPYATAENTTSQYEFVRAASKIALNKYAKIFVDANCLGLRRKLSLTQMLPQSGMNLVSDIRSASATMYDGAGHRLTGVTDSVYVTPANTLMMNNYNYAKDNWATWIKRA